MPQAHPPVIFPPRLWPHQAQLLLCTVVVLLTGLVTALVVQNTEKKFQATQSQHRLLSAQLAALTSPANSAQAAAALAKDNLPARSNLPDLPNATAVDNVVRDMTAFAQRQNLQLASLVIETTAKSTQELAQRHIAVQVRGSYPELKAWMSEMLARYPWLAIKSLNWRATERIKQGKSANTINREHDYLRGMFNELTRLGHWSKDNPLNNLRRFKIAENELKSLSVEEIELLLKALDAARNPHVRLITKVSLSTGGRWGEIEAMKISQVGTGLIQFTKTKSGRTRAIPISPILEYELRAHYKAHGVEQRVFQSAYPTFKENIHRAGIVLPEGQSAHVLRHTFASHFMKNGGNILALQRALGHSDLKMTMRYAHLAPEHLQEVVSMNPLARLTLG